MLSFNKILKSKNKLTLLISLLTSSVASYAQTNNYTIPTESNQTILPSSALKALSNGVAKLAKASKKGLVFISVSKKMKLADQRRDPFFEFFFGRRPNQSPKQQIPEQKGLGSGFLIDLKKGYIITNNHVIDGADTISVKLANGSKYEAEIIGKDSNTDVAVIKIKDNKYNHKNLKSLLLDDSDKLEVGAFVVALGAPFNLKSSVTFGVVSATGRGSLAIAGLGDFIQTDAAINPGNSGGPLLNIDGKVIGMNTAIYSKSGGYNGVGFSIPSNLVRRIATNLINGGKAKRGFLGVQLQPLLPEWSNTLKLPKDIVGVIIKEVSKDSPAERAGLQVGDVIYQAGSKKFEKVTDLTNVIGLMKAGQKTNLRIYRKGKDLSVGIVVGLWPDDKEKVATKKMSSDLKKSQNPFGFTTRPIKDLSEKERSDHKIKSKTGLVVAHVKKDSIAEDIGLREYDVIVLANMQASLVSTPKRFDKFLRSPQAKDSVIIFLERDGVSRFIQLKK